MTVGALLATSATALGHHAATMFDRSMPIVVTGTLQEFRWANPHSWIALLVPNGQGATDKWVLEGTSVTSMVRNGWTKDSLAPGDQIRAVVAPRKDGSHGGEFMSVTNLRTGRILQQDGRF